MAYKMPEEEEYQHGCPFRDGVSECLERRLGLGLVNGILH